MNQPDAVRAVCLSLVLLAAVAGSGAAQTAPDLLRAVHERQRQMLAEIEDVTLTYDDPYPLVTPTTIHAEQSTGPDGPRLLVRFTKEEGADWRPAREETDLADVFWWLLP